MKHTLAFIIMLSFATMMATGPVCAETAGTSRFHQIVQPLPRKVDYSYSYDATRNALVVEILGVAPQDLGALDQYDERLVRKLVVKERAGLGSQVTFFLRDQDVRVTITDHQEPPRLHIDFFDKNFREGRDPVTGLPTTGTATPAPVQDDQGFKTPRGAEQKPQDGALRLAVPQQAETSKAYGLLQPKAEASVTEAPDTRVSDQAPEGRGKAWASYPYYVYRLQASLYKGGKNAKDSAAKNALTTLDSDEAMAKYAANLYDLGHEQKALAAYQKVLHKGASVFDRDPTHLWRLAEANLGQGNKVLADGYYQALREKHPDSPLSGFAILRQLDLKAIAATEKGDVNALADLQEPLRTIAVDPKTNPELAAQVAIRQAYWSGSAKVDPEEAKARDFIPAADVAMQRELRQDAAGGEGIRTTFIAQTIALYNALDPNSPWDRAVMDETGRYLEKFRGEATGSFLKKVEDRVVATIQRELIAAQKQQKPMRVIEVYEAIPASLRDTVLGSPLAQAVAFAYRELGQSDKALPFFRAGTRQANDGVAAFKAQMWLAIAAMEAQGQTRGTALAKAGPEASAADQKALTAWQALKPEERSNLYREWKPILEDNVMSPALLKTPMVITMEQQATVAPSLAGPGQEPAPAKPEPLPLENTVRLMARLAQKMDAMGDKATARKARANLLALKPEAVKANAEDSKIWVEEASRLAEEYRQANQYYEAGDAYVKIGNAKANEGRAESLYKGGLLLYRAGRREEALAAFKKASEDGNDRVYAELAEKRLMQLQQ